VDVRPYSIFRACPLVRLVIWNSKKALKSTDNPRIILNTKSKTKKKQEARKPRDAAAVLFGLKFADNIHYELKSSQAQKAMLQSSKHTAAKQNLSKLRKMAIQGHVFWSLRFCGKGISD